MMVLPQYSNIGQRTDRDRRFKTGKIMRVLITNAEIDLAKNVDHFRSALAHMDINIIKEDYIPCAVGIIRMLTIEVFYVADEMAVTCQAKKYFGRSFNQQFLYQQ